MGLSVVVDGGGSGCRLSLFDENGKILASRTEGPASLSLGEERAWANIRSGISRLAQQCSLPADWVPGILCLGLAGALQTERRKKFLSLLPSTIDCTLVTDGCAQLLGVTGGQPGVCLAVGTGSVLHWLDKDGQTGMSGGWGFPVGDEASGAWLGMKLIAAYINDRDGYAVNNHRIPMGAPLRSHLEQIVGNTVSDIQLWTTCKDPAKLASLVPCLLQHADEGDAIAKTLINAGVNECLNLINTAPKDLPVYLAGGLKAVYQQPLKEKLSERMCEAQGNAVDGLYALLAHGGI